MPLRISLFLALLAGLLLSACSTAENVADETVETGEDVAQATGDVAGDAWNVVTDAAGASWNAVTDLFDDDVEADAAALVRPTMAGSAEGTVRFMEMGDALHIMVSLRGLQPGMHGFHIHQNPACGPADTDNDGQPEPAGAAGGHWDPMNTNDHGAPGENLDDKHVGDLGNLEVGADGMVETEFTIDNFPAGEHDVTQRAIVVHQGTDDLETDPAGDSGSRVGCGVIEARM